MKLYATGDQVDLAAALAGFQSSWGTPPPTVREAWFLGTDDFRLRLVFNVLTSPHVFLGGNITAYHRQVRSAERSAAALARSLTAHDGPQTLHEAWAALWQAPDGRTGKDYLGYLVAPHLLSVLTCGLTDHHPTTPPPPDFSRAGSRSTACRPPPPGPGTHPVHHRGRVRGARTSSR
ncbi:hypothetical protein GCM10010207_86160 [Streptomyces atratus]|uniref:hypothetical protein n=1 Tax=Streptomyces atratus TaxID=1893 RepID=UPI0016708313|nr:hypothetical protein [Streptomyces atratus]GGT75917.1 hypothetical protein GCM10010207_86160 [Streptomyces atratus]